MAYQKRIGATEVYHYVPKGEAQSVVISEDRYREASDGYEGWCDVCGDFTRDCTEGDAEKYPCPQCETADSVCGAEQALIMGKFTFGGDDAE